jgi:hypothetical protein
MTSASPLASLIEGARRRGFIGLALDGVDVDASIASAGDPLVLVQALDIATRANESIWAERLVRRLGACDGGADARLRLATILASKGEIGEARSTIAAIAPAEQSD